MPIEGTEKETGLCTVLGGPGTACTKSRPCPRDLVIPNGIDSQANDAFDLWASLRDFEGMPDAVGSDAYRRAVHGCTGGERYEIEWRLQVIQRFVKGYERELREQARNGS